MKTRNWTYQLPIPLLFSLFLVACTQQGGDAVLPSANSEAGPAPAKSEKKAPVLTRAVKVEPLATPVEAVGTARALKAVTIYPESSGEVVSVSFEGGSRVKSGQVLIQLEDDDERLAVELARVDIEDATRLLKRYEITRDSGAVTQSNLDDARSQFERANIALKQAELAFNRRQVKAPFDGYIGFSDIDAGAQIAPSTPIANLDDRSRLLVAFQLPELFHGQVQPGQKITMKTWAKSSIEVEGTVFDIDTRVDEQTRTFSLRAMVENTGDNLRPGMSFRVVLQLDAGRYPLVPETALQWGGDGSFVWAVKENQRTYRVPATIMQRVPGHIFVDAELSAGALIVYEGVQNVREGGLVNILDTQVAQAPLSAVKPAQP